MTIFQQRLERHEMSDDAIAFAATQVAAGLDDAHDVYSTADQVRPASERVMWCAAVQHLLVATGVGKQQAHSSYVIDNKRWSENVFVLSARR